MSDWNPYLQLALAGMAGAVIRSLLVHNGSVLLIRYWEKNGKKGIDLGIVGSMLIGAAVGVVVDQSPVAAFIGAISGSLLLEELAKKSKSK